MTVFQTLRNRDAWATIRGFVYQVNLTIQQWLSLGDGELLELERGEDIDLVGRAIASGDDQERDRLLNQVKSREARLSLRSPEALKAIASFVEHRTANPDLRLRFRFTTNAQVTSERPPVFDGNEPAITIWQQLNCGTLQGQPAQTAVEKIHGFLQNQSKPEKLNPDTWGRFITFLKAASTADVLGVISRFEWETSHSSPADLMDRLTQRLMADGYARTHEHAEELYRRLFLHVFKLLTKEGAKVLTKTELLAEVSLPALSEEMQKSLLRLQELHHDLTQHVMRHEIQLQRQSKAIADLQQSAVGTANLEAEVILGKLTPSVQIPPLVVPAIDRAQTVSILIGEFAAITWLAIHGPSGTGKTQLAVLIARRLGNCAAWIRLGNESERMPLALARLDRSLEVVSGQAPCPNRERWYKDVCATFANGSLIVLDDAPRLVSNDPFSEAVVLLAHACRHRGMRLLATSPHPLSDNILDLTGRTLVVDKSVPLLTDEEATAVLLAYGAPPQIRTPGHVSFINAVCCQHPTLLVAAARYLKNKGWQLTERELSDLLGSRHAKGVNQDTLSRLLRTVPKEESREILERLTLIIYRFGTNEVKTVAAVPPIVERPVDRLEPLLGLWVQQEAEGQYLVSPLAKALGPANLSEDTKRATNLALGTNVLRRKHLDQSDASNAIIHFCGAQAWDMAGHVLITALQAMMEHGIPAYDAGLLAIWSKSGMPLPVAMSLSLRLMIRGQQIALRAKAGHPVTFLLGSLDEIAAGATDAEAPAVFAASMHAGNALAGTDVEASCRNIVRALEQLPRLSKQEEFADILSAIPLAKVVWIGALRLSTQEHLLAWLKVLTAVPPAMRVELSASEDADISCMAVADAVWLAEAQKPVGEQAWPSVMASLENLAATAQKLGVEILWACAVRSQIIVLAEYEGEFEKAIQLAQDALGIVTDPRGRFVLLDCVARQFMYKNKNSEASKWFAQAAAIRTDDYRLLRLRSLMHASVALEANEFPQTQEYLEAALAIGRADDSIPVSEFVKAIGEMCVLRGLANDLSGAYAALDEAASRLLAAKEDTLEWKGLFMTLGHVSGYFTTISCTGKPPEKTIGDEPYGAPVRGMFLRYNEAGCAGLYDEAKACGILVQLAQFADALAISERAEHWALVGMEVAHAAGAAMAIDVLSLQVVPLFILHAKHADALALAVEAAAITVAGVKERESGRSPLEIGLDVASILGAKPNESWNQAETNAITFGLLPAACGLATESFKAPDAARRHAQDLVSACRQLRQTGSHGALWDQSADLIEKAFVVGTSPQALMAISNQLDDKVYGWLRTVGYVCATAQPGISLDDVCRVQLMLMPLAHANIRKLSRMTYDRILVPWLTESWLKLFADQKFRFSSPSLVEKDLLAAAKLPEFARAQAILRVVARGLGLRVDPQAHEWIEAAKIADL